MRAVRSRPPVRPAVRLRAAPPLDPPYDDESTPPAWSRGSADQLTFELASSRGGRPGRGRPPGGPPTPTGPPTPGSPPTPTGPPTLPVEALAAASTAARQAARRFLGTCLEILNGYRPANQIRPLVQSAEATTIIGQLAAGSRRLAAFHPANRPADGIQLRLVRVCEPRPGIAEAAAVLHAAGRSWAMAFRLERRQGSWLGTVIQLL
ncbi:Rv3235 family protein [Micromonospora sp. NPDC003197]